MPDNDLQGSAISFWQGLVVILLFIVFSIPLAYATSTATTRALCLPATCTNGAPNMFGIIIHGVFFLLVFLIFIRL